MKAYPKWFYVCLISSLLIIVVTGCLLIPTALEMRFEQDVMWRLAYSQRLVAVASHTTFSYLMLTMVGALSTIHMRAGVKTKTNYRTGFSLVTLFVVLLVTGIGLLYLGDEDWILSASALHSAVGLSLVVIFCLHYFNNKKTRQGKS